MDKMLYISMTGLKQIMNTQASNSHNLANVSTSGFRAELRAFQDVPVYGSGHDSRSYAVAKDNGNDFSQGSIVTTGNDLDIAIKGNGFIAVQSASGQEGYSRAGSLQLSPNGLLTTASGQPVLGNGGPITLPPASKVAIGEDGTVSVIALGQDSTSLAVVDRIKLVKPDHTGISKGVDGLFYLNDDGVADADASVKVVSGAIEMSNVNVIDSMVKMIELQRNYEMQSKLMKTASDNDNVSSKLLSMT